MCEWIRNLTFWQAIGAIATAVGAIATAFLAGANLWNLKRQERKEEERETREIAEKVIKPLRRDLKMIITKIQDQCLISFWRWGEIENEKHHPIYKSSFESIKKKIKEFHIGLSRGQSLSIQRYESLRDLIKQEMKKNPFIIHSLGQQSKSEIDLNSTYYQLLIGGDFNKITFFRLIFKGQNLDEEIKGEQKKRFKRGFQSPNQELADEEFFLNGSSILKSPEKKRECFNNIISSIFVELKKKPKLQEYISECRRISKEAYNLDTEFKKFN